MDILEILLRLNQPRDGGTDDVRVQRVVSCPRDDDLGLAEGTGHHIHDAMQALADTGVVTVEGRGMDETADFDFDGLQEIHERQARRQRTEGVMEEL